MVIFLLMLGSAIVGGIVGALWMLFSVAKGLLK
jgi:hypothetical protein